MTPIASDTEHDIFASIIPHRFRPEDHRVPRSSKPNVPLLRKAVEWVEVQDQLDKDGEWSAWNQDSWWDETECGTTYCLAGFVCQALGYEYVKYSETTVINPETGDKEYVGYAAARELGLNGEHADLLFYGGNDAREIRHLAETFAGERL